MEKNIATRDTRIVVTCNSCGTTIVDTLERDGQFVSILCDVASHNLDRGCAGAPGCREGPCT
jgi:hypothetical protein